MSSLLETGARGLEHPTVTDRQRLMAQRGRTAYGRTSSPQNGPIVSFIAEAR